MGRWFRVRPARHARSLAALALAAAFAGAAVAAAASPPIESLLEQRLDRVVLQEHDLSCGAAALATVLTHQFGDTVSEREVAIGLMGRPEYLADPMIVRARFGFSLLDLKRYVEGRGYRGVGFGRMAFDDLVERAPAIVPIDVRGYPHFVVFRGAYRGRVLLADPAFGNRTMPQFGFEQVWIPYAEIGRVAFVVERRDGRRSANRLAPEPSAFPTLN